MSAPAVAPVVALPSTLPGLLQRAIAARGSAPFLGVRTSTAREQSLTLAEFGSAVDNAAARLAAALKPGAHLLVRGAPVPGFAAAPFAAARANLVLVPLDARMTPDTVERISTLTTPSAILLGTGATLEPVTIPSLADLPVLDLDELVDAPGAAAVAALASRATAPPAEPIEILCTPGSTGSPRASRSPRRCCWAENGRQRCPSGAHPTPIGRVLAANCGPWHP